MKANLLIKNCRAIAQIDRRATHFLRGAQMAEIPILENAWISIVGDRIADYGPMSTCPEAADSIIDASGSWVLPAFCDSHTHIVYAQPRSREFVARIQGKSYQEIAAEGGGILNSAKHLANAPEDQLVDEALSRIHEAISLGTGLVEIKSGYGLSEDSELKMLRVIKRLKTLSPIPIKATFLAAHALPTEFKQNKAGFLNGMIDSTLPKVVEEGLADYVDIFCETGFFDAADTAQLLTAAAKYGLKGKIHTNQFTHIGGIQMAGQCQAISVDHLEVLNDEEMDYLKTVDLIPTLLPQAPFFLNDAHFPPMRKMLDKGLGFALASDFNPGSSPSGNMQFVMSLACVKGRILPSEAINAATLNGAAALEATKDFGSIDKGKKANLIISRPMAEIAEFCYYFANNVVEKMIINGQLWKA